MNLRKIFDRPSAKQKAIIDAEVASLTTMASEKARKYNNDCCETARSRDFTCPKCRSEKVVDKISRIQGHGEIHGSFRLGFGDIDGHSDTDTNEINNCNSCGHQWKKYDYHYQHDGDVIKGWMQDIHYALDGKYDWGDKTLKMLTETGIKAETIYKLSKTKISIFSNDITLKLLRTKFKSIYD